MRSFAYQGHLLTAVLALPSLGAGIDISLLPRTVAAAATWVNTESSAGFPWFEYERTQLTQQAIESLRDTAATAGIASLVDFDGGPTLAGGECKTFPGDDAWPSEAQWDALNGLLGGALVPTVPIAAACYHSWGVYDEAQCAAISENFTNPYLHLADPTSTMWPIWQGRSCLPTNDPDDACTLGGYPAYAVEARNVAQVQLAVNFARNHNLRLVVKNTGHCYLGKSNGAGALSVWTHRLQGVEFLPDYRAPGGGYAGMAFKVGAGVTVRQVYEAAHAHGVSALGGMCESVGFAGGYIAGGGHTPLSGLYGMAADQTLAFEVVTADGRFVTASPRSHPDLFWALSGGGGGTYGVVTSVIVRVHPKVASVASQFVFGTSPTVSNETFFEAVRAYFERFVTFTDAQTYSFFSVIYDPETAAYAFGMNPFFAPNHTLESFNRLVQPLFDRWAELGIDITPDTREYDAFLPAYEDLWSLQVDKGSQMVGRADTMPGNRLLPRANWEDPAKWNATWAVVERHLRRGWRLYGYHQAPRNHLGVDNAVSSVWRETVAFLLSGGNPPADATPEQLRATHEFVVNDMFGPFREVAPASAGGGSYLNEAHVMEPDWQADFYGTQYADLLRIKARWDPKDTFYATTAVGSERWEVRTQEQGVQTQNGRLCRL